mgnify:CR=1 FL=1
MSLLSLPNMVPVILKMKNKVTLCWVSRVTLSGPERLPTTAGGCVTAPPSTRGRDVAQDSAVCIAGERWAQQKISTKGAGKARFFLRFLGRGVGEGEESGGVELCGWSLGIEASEGSFESWTATVLEPWKRELTRSTSHSAIS